MGLPTDIAPSLPVDTNFLNSIDMSHTADRVVEPTAQDPFGLNRAAQASKFDAIHAESTGLGLPSAQVATPEAPAFKVSVSEMQAAEEAAVMAQATEAARLAINKLVGYDAKADLAAKIAEVNARSEREELAAIAARVDAEHRRRQRLIDEDNNNKRKAKVAA